MQINNILNFERLSIFFILFSLFFFTFKQTA